MVALLEHRFPDMSGTDAATVPTDAATADAAAAAPTDAVPSEPEPGPRILFIDAYDSFAHNIVALLQDELDAEVTTIHIDDARYLATAPAATSSAASSPFSESTRSSRLPSPPPAPPAPTPTPAFLALLSTFDAAIAGPGPGNPLDAPAVGLIAALWQLPEASLLPVLGICLGMQSLSAANGALITRLNEPRHGVVARLTHANQGVFRGVGEMDVVLYHSLRVVLDREDEEGLWGVRGALKPLAYDTQIKDNGAVLQAVTHTTKPFTGLQYHPESICTSAAGARVVRNWWQGAKTWLASRGRVPRTLVPAPAQRQRASSFGDAMTCPPATAAVSLREELQASARAEQELEACYAGLAARGLVPAARAARVAWRRVRGAVSTAGVCAALNSGAGAGAEAVVLESGIDAETKEPVRAETGNKSIVGVFDPERPPLRVLYYTSGRVLELRAGGALLFRREGVDVWAFLGGFMRRCGVSGEKKEGDEEQVGEEGVDAGVGAGPKESPFWGGLVGWIGYEAGLETIGVAPCGDGRRPDMAWVFVGRSVVVDLVGGGAFVQSCFGAEEEEEAAAGSKGVRAKEETWLSATTALLTKLAEEVDVKSAVKMDTAAEKEVEMKRAAAQEQQDQALDKRLCAAVRHAPSQKSYEDAVLSCQESIRAGDSYELCLTAQTTVLVPRAGSTGNSTSSYHLYTRLRALNPAPFSAYIRLPGTNTITSSSPERFLRWTRGDCTSNTNAICQYRPIKGTVKKTPGMTRQRAEELLNTPKERAENLMIVDLVRHDLHGVVGAGNVVVRKLMGVEEYRTVWQLVSVVEGDLGPHSQSQSQSHFHSNHHDHPRHHNSNINQNNDNDNDNDNDTATDTATGNTRNGNGSINTTPHHDHEHKTQGIAVLAASLPPGSMTGAPKKRSCELLSAIENGVPRGVYSGVLGYLDVGGGGDFSVVIRSAVCWEGGGGGNGNAAGIGADGSGSENGGVRESVEGAGEGSGLETACDVWTVGAGGAVTAQSEARAEYEEMVAKLESTLRIFEGRA